MPVAAILPSRAFDIAWVGLLPRLRPCWIAAWRPSSPPGPAAYLPVAVELWFLNVHLVLAALVVLGLRRWPWAFAIGAAIKLAPGLGILYLAAPSALARRGDRGSVGLVILAVSVALGPTAWSGFIATVQARGPGDISGLLPVPYSRPLGRWPLLADRGPPALASGRGSASRSWSWRSRLPCRHSGWMRSPR